MSESRPDPASTPVPATETHSAGPPAALPVGKVLVIAAVALFTFLLGSLWSVRIYNTTRLAMNPSGSFDIPRQLGQEELGIVDQVPFELNVAVARYRAEANQRLNGYGWVDRQAGVIHIPIDRAIQLIVAEQPK